MRILSLLGLLLSICCLSASAQQIPFIMEGSHIYLEAEVDEDYQFLLFDTGAASNLISMEFAVEHGLDLGSEIRIMSFGGTQVGYHTTIPTLSLEGLTLKNVPFIAVPKVTSNDQPYIGVIGCDLFKKNRITIDYEQSLIDVQSSSTSKVNSREGQTMHWDAKIPAIDATIEYRGQSLSGRMVLDCGADAHIIVMSGTDAQKSLFPIISPVVEQSTISPSGQFISRIGRAELLRIGRDESLNAVPMKVMGDQKGARFYDNYIGFIGYEVLKKYSITIDFPQEKVWFTRSSQWDSPMQIHLTGLNVEMDKSRNFYISFAVKEGAGYKAGLRTGDKIVSVDSKTAKDYSTDGLNRILNSGAGEEIHIEILRNNKTYSFRFKKEDVL